MDPFQRVSATHYRLIRITVICLATTCEPQLTPRLRLDFGGMKARPRQRECATRTCIARNSHSIASKRAKAAWNHPTEVRKRFAAADSLDSLAVTEDAEQLTESIMKSGILPPKAVRDAAHIAVATVHKLQYLLTWNCKHLPMLRLRNMSRICVVWLDMKCQQFALQKNDSGNQVMKNDPIVQQVHEIRERLAAFDKNVAGIFADMRSREKLVGDRLTDRRNCPNKPIHPTGGSAASGIDTSSPATG